MLLLSPVLRHIVYPVMGALGYFRRRRSPQISVITYHGVLPSGYQVKDNFLDGTLVTASDFRRQLRLIKSHYQVLSPSEFRNWLQTGHDLPGNAALLTCDDGLVNHATEMLPILQEEGLNCLFFVTGASLADPYTMLWYVELYLMLQKSVQSQLRIEVANAEVCISLEDLAARRTGWNDLMKRLSCFEAGTRRALLEEVREKLKLPTGWKSAHLEEPALRSRFCVMGVPELKHLIAAGMSIGAHSMSHPIPSQQAEELLTAEMISSKRALADVTGERVWAFAYPFGDSASASEREYRLAEQAGFECAFRNVGGPLRSKESAWALPRIHVSLDMNLGEFEAHVSGFHDELRARLGR